MAGCDAHTGAQVSRMSRWLPYEKIGSHAYVRGTIVKKTAFVAGEEATACVAGKKKGVCAPWRMSPERWACVAGREGARRVSPRKKMVAATGCGAVP
jgi:hypothetical protein